MRAAAVRRKGHPEHETEENGSGQEANQSLEEQYPTVLIPPNPAFVIPKPGGTLAVISAFLGLLIMVGICTLLLYRFMAPMPRNPGQVGSTAPLRLHRAEATLRMTNWPAGRFAPGIALFG